MWPSLLHPRKMPNFTQYAIFHQLIIARVKFRFKEYKIDGITKCRMIYI